MTQIILIIIIIVLTVLLFHKRSRDVAVGICSFTLDQTIRKNVNVEKALTFLSEKNEASNEEIRKHLGVSRRTVARYMTQLEKEGRVEQIGEIGRGVVYRAK